MSQSGQIPGLDPPSVRPRGTIA